MGRKLGIWIDHRKAFIIEIDGKLATTKEVESKVEKLPKRTEAVGGNPSRQLSEPPADDRRFHAYQEKLNKYYDSLLPIVSEAESVLILGPAEAKVEFGKRLAAAGLSEKVKEIESMDSLTENQIVARVKEYFGVA